MILSAAQVLALNKENNLLEGLCDRELGNPEGATIDLRVGKVQRLISESSLGADETGGKRTSPRTLVLGDISVDGHKEIIMGPGEYFLVTTMEKVNSPAKKILYHPDFPEGYLVPRILPRSSLQRGGVSLHYAPINVGYTGELTFGLKNLGTENFRFELGARMFSVEYHPVVGEIVRAYSGQHQGGRVTSQGREEVQN